MPRPLLRFISVFAVVAACSSLVVAPAFAAPTSVGTIHGTVADANGPVSGLCVSVVDPNWQWTGTQTDANGAWTIDVAPGSYHIQYQDCRGVTPRLADAWWSPTGPVAQNQDVAVDVAENASTTSVDIVLQTGLAFTGSVQDQQGNPVDGACINPVDTDNNWVAGVQTPGNNLASGQFATDGLLPGSYKVRVSPCNNSQAQQFAQGWIDTNGNVVADQQNAATFALGGSDLALPTITVVPGTRIVGTVTDAYHAPLANICVNVDTVGNNSNWVAGTQTQSDGTYSMQAVLPGDYYLNFNDCRPNPSAVGTNYDGTPNGSIDRNQATTIHVDGSQAQIGPYDQMLLPGGDVSGTVTTTAGPAGGVCVNAIQLTTTNGQVGGNWIAGTQTRPDGTYTVGPVPAEDLVLQVSPCNNNNPSIVDGFYNGNGNLAIQDPTAATTVHPQTGQTLGGIDIRADVAALLSGHVTTAGGPAANVCVSAIDPTTGANSNALTGNDGSWSTSVPSGSYLLQANDCQNGRGLAGRFIPSGTDPATASHIIATSGTPVSGLDTDLSAAPASSIRGRITTPGGPVPGACAVALIPGRDPVGYGQTDAGGNFVIGSLPSGAYVVGILDCGFLSNQNSQPTGVHDPADPSIVYPVQWSNGTPVKFNKDTWQDPDWTVVSSAGPTDLGDICLGCTPSTPAVQPTTTTAAGTPNPLVAPPTAPVMPTAPPTAPPVVAPRTSPPVTAARRPDATVTTKKKVTTTKPGSTTTPRFGSSTVTTIAKPTTTAPSSTRTTLAADHATAPSQRIETRPAVATSTAPSSWTDWWWLLALAALAGGFATALPALLRNRSKSSPEWPV